MEKNRKMKASFAFSKSGKVLFLFLLVILALSLTVFIIQQWTKTQLHVVGIATYPANIDFESISSYGIYNPAALSNPNIGAVDVNMNWVDVEPQQGVFNWAPADNEVAAWAGQGKKFALIVRYIKEVGGIHATNCESPQFMPSWEIARIRHFCDRDRGTVIPDYFGPTFKADLKAYVAAIAQHFASGPYLHHLVYVRVGVGEGGEGFPLMQCLVEYCQGDYQADQNQLVAWGYSPSNWKAWQQEMMSYYKSIFRFTTVIYPISKLDIDPTTGHSIELEVAYWAAANGMGIGQQGLAPGFTYAQIRTITSYIQSHYPHTYIQFQTVAPVVDIREAQGDITTAYQYGGRSIEWYSQDVLNPSYQLLFQQWQQMVNSKFAKVKN